MPGGHISDILYVITHNNRKVSYEVAAEFFYGWGHSRGEVENLWSVPGINIWGVVGSFPASVPASLVTPRDQLHAGYNKEGRELSPSNLSSPGRRWDTGFLLANTAMFLFSGGKKLTVVLSSESLSPIGHLGSHMRK